MVEWLFLAVPLGCLQFVIVVFPDHTHLLFWKLIKDCLGWCPSEIRHCSLKHLFNLFETASKNMGTEVQLCNVMELDQRGAGLRTTSGQC